MIPLRQAYIPGSAVMGTVVGTGLGDWPVHTSTCTYVTVLDWPMPISRDLFRPTGAGVLLTFVPYTQGLVRVASGAAGHPQDPRTGSSATAQKAGS